MKKLAKKVWLNRILIGLFLLFFCALFFFPSVLNRDPQIQTRLLITAIGIDVTEEGEVEFSGIAVLPSTGDTAQVKSVTVTNTAPSLAECIENISEQYGKQSELGLCGLVVLGDSTDNVDILPHLEFLLSSAYISPGAYLIHTTSSKAVDLLEFASSQNPSTAEILSSVVEFNDKTARIATRTLLEFLSESHSISRSSVLPSVKASEQKKSNNGESSGGGESKQSGGDSDSKRSAVSSLNTAVIYKNGRKTGELTDAQTLGFNLATNEADKGLIVLENFSASGFNLGRIDCWVYSSNFKHKTYFDSDTPVFEIKIEVTLQFQDQHKIIRAWQKNGKEEEDIINPLIKAFEEKIKANVLSAYNHAKTVNADIFAVNTEFSRFHNSRFVKMQKHSDVFQLSEPKVQVKVAFK